MLNVRQWKGAVQSLIDKSIPAIAVTTEDQSSVSSTTLVDAIGLSLDVVANKTYAILSNIVVYNDVTSQSGAPGVKFAFTVPTGSAAAMFCNKIDIGEGATSAIFLGNTLGAYTSVGNVDDPASPSVFYFRGYLKAGTTGKLTFQFSQNSSSTDATILSAGSHIILTKAN